MRIVCTTLPDRPESIRARGISGFACIRCGCTIYEYCVVVDETPPSVPFLLCPPCRDRLNAMGDRLPSVLGVLRRHPLPREKRFDRSAFPYARGYHIPDVQFPSGAVMRHTAMPILLADKPVLGLSPPDGYGGPVLLTVMLGSGDGVPRTIVRTNVWDPPDPGWRFERPANRYSFEKADGSTILRLAFLPGGVIRIERLRCRFGDLGLEIDGNGATLNGTAITIPNSSEQLVGVRLS